MANCNNLFKEFNGEGKLKITGTKKSSILNSQSVLRTKIKKYFKDNHSKYIPTFNTQGSYIMGTIIRTKDDTCDLDDGVYFKTNPDNKSCKELQQWIKDAVDGTTNATPVHRNKCITVDYKAGYNIDLPVFIFDGSSDLHPSLAVKNAEWQIDDPKEFFVYFKSKRDKDKQLVRIVRYLKAWCNLKGKNMPSGLSMTVLALNNWQPNERDDVSLKYTLIEIENQLKPDFRFKCEMPTTPKDNLFKDYDQTRKANFLGKLSIFITDAKTAVDTEKNQLKASNLWKEHLGEKFPNGEDKNEKAVNASLLSSTIGIVKPYYGFK